MGIAFDLRILALLSCYVIFLKIILFVMKSKLLISCRFIVVVYRTPSKETYGNACRKVDKSCSLEVVPFVVQVKAGYNIYVFLSVRLSFYV